MKLRTRLNLVVAALTVVFVAVLLAEEIQDMRGSVREEIDAANVVASQLLGPLAMIHGSSAGTAGVIELLRKLGHVRANDILLRDAQGHVLYQSPTFTYKAGRAAPAWFAHLMAPNPTQHRFSLPGGSTLVVAGQPSRAILDAWDDLTRLLTSAVVLLVAVNGLAFWSVERALSAFPVIVRGLERLRRGELTYRLPPLQGPEAGAIGAAFNRMAQAVEDNVQAERKAREAEARLEERREQAALLEQRIEEERRLIAHELHDELGQSVTAIRSLAMAIVGRTGEKPSADTARLIEAEAGRLYDAMHGLIPRLLPVTLDSLGLAGTLENLVRDWQRRYPSVVLSLRHELPQDLGSSVTLAAYRVVQEGLINALRHAQARRVDIELACAPCSGQGPVRSGPDPCRRGGLVLTVQDDGVGLPADWARPGHFGLRGLIDRVERLGGTLTLGVREPHGARLHAQIPLPGATLLEADPSSRAGAGRDTGT
jgi:two-component system sensor histidine kinase UhpB